jgi:hypothetical protein
MKTNHLFASAAIAAVLAGALPAQAQILGGGIHGGVTDMQAATFGGGLAPVHSAASGQTDLSAAGRAGARVNGLDRVDRPAKTATHEAVRDAGDTKASAAGALRESVGAGESAASTASKAAQGTARAAVGSAAATGVTAAGQAEASAANVDTVGAGAGALSVGEVPRAKAEPGSSKHSSGQPVTTTKPNGAGSTRHSSTERDNALRGPDTHEEADANASASANASAAR